MSNTAKTLIEALSALQSKMEQPSKNAVNPHFKNKYADLAACMEAVRPHLTGLGLAVTQATRLLDNGFTVLDTTLHHVSGEKITGTYPINPTQNNPQGYGSAMTYARRYALCALLGIVADDDDDGNAASSPATVATKPSKQEPKDAAKEAADNYIAQITAAKTADEITAIMAKVDAGKLAKDKTLADYYQSIVDERDAALDLLARKGA